MSSEDRIVGVDVLKSGSDLSQFKYAVAYVEGAVIKKVEEMSFGRLIRVLWELKPSILAVDNVLELGGNKKNLVKFLKLLPPSVNVVQVNIDEKPVSLKDLAHKAGLIEEGGKLDPFKTAIILAYLAREGYGKKLVIFEKKVKISVSPGRSGVAGGSRTEKFQRNLRSIVSRVVKNIKERLDKAGIDYDLLLRKSKGGVERAEFIVYASREELYGVVKQIKSKDVIVRVRPVLNRRLLNIVESNLKEPRYLIVGYDPGTEAGLAVLDLDKNLLYLTSGKELDRAEVLALVVRFGIPVVVATDKNPPPEAVKKLSSALGAILYVPPKSLTTAEKEMLVAEFLSNSASRFEVKNTHERDALSAVLKAYKAFEEKMEKVADMLREIGLVNVNMQKYKVKVLMNETVSSVVEDIINDLVSNSRFESSQKEVHEITQSTQEASERNYSLVSKIAELEKEREMYKQKVKVLEERVRELENDLNVLTSGLKEQVLKDRKVSELLHRLKNVEVTLNRVIEENTILKDKLVRAYDVIRKIYLGKHVLIPKFSEECLEFVEPRENNLPIVFVSEATTLNEKMFDYVARKKIALILPPGASKTCEDLISTRLIPAATANEVYEVNECLVLVDKDVVYSISGLVKQLEEEKKRRERRLTYEELEKLISEYRLFSNGKELLNNNAG